jgi:hypothetical protein
MEQNPDAKRVIEGIFPDDAILDMNAAGYNAYYLPNGVKNYAPGITVSGSLIDDFKFVFVDFDLKSAKYASKDAFLMQLATVPKPSLIVDSGNGIHAYWRVADLDAMTYLRLSRRLMRKLNTDEAVGQIFQLMRLPETLNTKVKDNFKLCETIQDSGIVYLAEELDKVLPPILVKDEQYCQQHYDKTYNLNQQAEISTDMPPKFGQLLKDSHEAKELWAGSTDDRSKNDYRLGHLMFANGFTKDEAASVLVNSAKALNRAPVHRQSYALNIIDKIWTFELNPKKPQKLSASVADILHRGGETLKGTPFRCHKRIDNTAHGFRLGQVIGLVAGSGVGKTAFALNMFRWFAQENPDYHHFFVPLEQPVNEIADRWQTMCGKDTALHSKVHLISNYDEDGNFRHLSFDEIREYIVEFQKEHGIKVGCVVVDHIGALKKKGKDGENQDLMDICHAMKAFAHQTNTLLVMQSQTSREKAGIGDLELDKDAAYGTMYFEAYCDYLITLWQPLKRCHAEPGCPTVTAFKYCKIRHKKQKVDRIQEDVPYYFYFDSDSEQMRDMTQDEMTSFDFFLKKATAKRKADRKTDIVQYQAVNYKDEVINGQIASTGHGTSH